MTALCVARSYLPVDCGMFCAVFVLAVLLLALLFRLEEVVLLDELAVATLLSLGFEQAAVEGTLRTYGGVEEALGELTVQLGGTGPDLATGSGADRPAAERAESHEAEGPDAAAEPSAKRIALDRARDRRA